MDDLNDYDRGLRAGLIQAAEAARTFDGYDYPPHEWPAAIARRILALPDHPEDTDGQPDEGRHFARKDQERERQRRDTEPRDYGDR